MATKLRLVLEAWRYPSTYFVYDMVESRCISDIEYRPARLVTWVHNLWHPGHDKVKSIIQLQRTYRQIIPLICHYNDVVMSELTSQITSVSIVCSTIHSATDQRKHQSSSSLAFVQGIHRWPVNSPHKRPVTRKMFPFDYVTMAHEYPINYIQLCPPWW